MDRPVGDSKNCLHVFFVFSPSTSRLYRGNVKGEETVGANEQRLQNQSDVTDKEKELLSLSVWMKWQLVAVKVLRH